jgi:hypothetical protein
VDSNGLAFRTTFISDEDLTTTPMGQPEYVSKRLSRVAFTVAGPALLSKTTFPLAMYVSMFVKPASAQIIRRSAIGNLPVPPTFTARSSAMYLSIAHYNIWLFAEKSG